MRALFWKEIRSFLGSMIGYIFILFFLIFSGVAHWIAPWEANFLEGTEVDMIPFFNLSPYIFLALIPAITMRMIAEERRNGTIELLFTRPITDLKIILAKYFAGVFLLIIAILPTIVYYFSLRALGMDATDELGNPKTVIDEGAMITSYIGLILFGSVFVAIGMFASSVTNNQIVAFILGIAICFLMSYGIDALGSYSLFGGLDNIVRSVGMIQHYNDIMKGVINASDVIYFLGIITIFITASLSVIKSLKR